MVKVSQYSASSALGTTLPQSHSFLGAGVPQGWLTIFQTMCEHNKCISRSPRGILHLVPLVRHPHATIFLLFSLRRDRSLTQYPPSSDGQKLEQCYLILLLSLHRSSYQSCWYLPQLNLGPVIMLHSQTRVMTASRCSWRVSGRSVSRNTGGSRRWWGYARQTGGRWRREA